MIRNREHAGGWIHGPIAEWPPRDDAEFHAVAASERPPRIQETGSTKVS
jgi:hypothetical protein